MSRFEALALAAALGYLAALGFAMQRLPYDVWGALVVVPVLAAISAPLIRRATAGDLARLRPYLWAGFGLKLAGAVASYYVRFDAYGGQADAGRYDAVGSVLAGDVRSGLTTPLSVLPLGQSTTFVEELTGLVYTVVGSSRLGGFMVFAWLSFWGLVLFLKAAIVAVPGLADRRYAVLLFAVPSLVYWGSSIGKESVVGFFLGLSAYGVALVLTDVTARRRGLVLAAVGLLGAARIRPHFAAIWAGAALIALVVRSLIEMQRSEDGRRSFRFSTVASAAVAVVGFTAIATATLEFFPDVDTEEDVAAVERVGLILDEVERRTTQGGSSFDPVPVNGPQDWPYAAARTLTRPLLLEARSFAELLPALEMTVLVIAGLAGWRRLVHVPKLFVTRPYITFAVVALVTFGVAFASVGNLGILVRQRSLVLPLLLLLWCVPPLGSGPSASGITDSPAERRSVRA